MTANRAFTRRAAAVAAGAAAAVLVATLTHHGRAQAHPDTGTGFSWLTPRPAPVTWQAIRLPGGTAILSYPPSWQRLPSDAGAVSVGLPAGSGNQVYLNATPQQGGETLRGWSAFRVQHLRDENARTANPVAQTEGLAFRGGIGSCLIDDYVTRVGATHYREIGCLVQGAHGASVIIAATQTGDWDCYRPVLEQTVAAYTVR